MTRSPAIGIDLGTTYCCVGIFQDGKVDIIPNEQGNRKTPSHVAFTHCERLIGEAAFNQVTLNPQNTVFDVKRLLGRKITDKIVQEDMKHLPFNVINVDGKVKILVNFMDQTEHFFPEEICAMVLGKLKEMAESYLGKEVANAVISVPACFNDSQRQATKDAGTIAGLNVMRIINEPTAAAITYGLNQKPRGGSLMSTIYAQIKGHENVMIFDFGGGTLDVSVLQIRNNKITVKSSSGNTHLGGEDINNILVNHLVDEFKEKHQRDITKNRQQISKLRLSVEKVKRTLSLCREVPVEVDEKIGVDFSITRSLFNELCTDLFQLIMVHVQKVLKDGRMKKTDINQVILIGGSSRIPRVQEMLQEFFDGKELNKTINLDEAVTYGAAIQAAILNRETGALLNRFIIQDVTTFSLKLKRNALDKVIIHKNSRIPIPIPAFRWATCVDDESSIQFSVFEGEHPTDEDEVNILGEFIVTGFISEPNQVVEFEITFSVDKNGIFSVSALDRMEPEKEIKVASEKGQLSQEQIEWMIENSKKFKAGDEERRERMETMIRLEDYCYDTKKVMENPTKNERIPQIKLKNVIDECNAVSNWIELNKMAPKEVIEKKESKLKHICEPILQLIS